MLSTKCRLGIASQYLKWYAANVICVSNEFPVNYYCNENSFKITNMYKI